MTERASTALGPLGLRDASVVVLGLGVTGVAVARALAAAGARVSASESRAEVPEAAPLVDAGVRVETGGHTDAIRWVEEADLVVPSPGIPPHAPVLAHALDAGVEVASEIELGARVARAPMVAITGTNGKTTVTRMTGAALSAAGRDAVVCGNIGDPFLTAVVDRPEAEVYVVEVSSFQLFCSATFHPRVSVVTNVAPDHLDWHGSMEAYLDAKARIAALQGREDAYVYPASQPELADLAPVGGPRRLSFGTEGPSGEGAWAEGDDVVARIDGREYRFTALADLAARGRPFVEDALAAAAAALDLGADPGAVGGALRSYTPHHHVVEPVGEVDGVRFVDDSKATNPHAVVQALRGFDSVVLVAGGRNKGLDLSPIAEERGRLRGVVAIGEATDDVVRAFSSSGVPVETAADLDEAVRIGRGMARAGDVVLLSPGCSSWDRFPSYAHRGRAFRQAVEALTRRAEP